MIKFLILVAVISARVVSLPAAAPARSPIPLEKGTQWIYEARVQWTPVAGDGPPGVRSNRFQWTASIVESIKGNTARAAVVHAWPDEVAGMDPVRPTGYSVLLESSNRLYRVRCNTKAQAGRLARRLAAAPEKRPTSAEVYLDLPLAVGKRWGADDDDLKREDGWYCWRVESGNERPIQVRGLPRTEAAAGFTVAYRTAPSHELFEISPGIGILRFEFEHHGTVASSDVRLIEFKRPALTAGQKR